MATVGCCRAYLAKATANNGAANVEPDPVRVPVWPLPPALAVARIGDGVLAVVTLVVLAQAPRARRMIAAEVAWMARCTVRRG